MNARSYEIERERFDNEFFVRVFNKKLLRKEHNTNKRRDFVLTL